MEVDSRTRIDAYEVLQRTCKEVHIWPTWNALIDSLHKPADTEGKLLPYLEVRHSHTPVTHCVCLSANQQRGLHPVVL